jgi:hypothetical protein
VAPSNTTSDIRRPSFDQPMKKGVNLTLVISILILSICQSTVARTLSPKVDAASSDADPHPSASSIESNSPLGVVKESYAAFARGDIPAIVNLIADQVDWQDVCPASLPIRAGDEIEHK